ncbi:heterokaryon incompatibility protein-domain-containing protein [Schizothecium vesticola]|uniref:Heterokaryon incompatibility protein-domain-containing protein n=1 Tax=Schizothecium vesticola TaxID=314040 RepID=A0AA40EX26_9PEZI|nr:heterokaryon incompatibility protein-domain-containing protein [Schizothecium vesticola]
MRLLNTSTLELHSFLSARHIDTPKYAILSHTWEDEEILFQDVRDGPHTIPRDKKGFAKVAGSARYAKAKGFDWIWIDTCCIDKSSSAELSEAINSMFLWYRLAEICFAYLSDVRSPVEFASSRWFTRGWTLQELIAPLEVEFLNSDWKLLGNRKGLAGSLSGITGVDERLLAGDSFITAYSISTRMAWASHRQTSREEDLAYSLLGIFNVTMPLIYGEGLQSAFRRLQEEIIETSGDQSIFAFRQYYWKKNGSPRHVVANPMTHYLASHPIYFGKGENIIDDDPYERNHTALHPITLHPHGVTFRAIVGPATYHLNEKTSMKTQLVILNCCFQNDPLARPAFLVADFDGLLARLKSPLLRALPSPGEGVISVQSKGWGPGPGPEGEKARG